MGHASAALTAQVWAERRKRVVDPGLGIYLANLMKRQRSMEIKELEGLLKAMEPRLDREDWEKQRESLGRRMEEASGRD